MRLQRRYTALSLILLSTLSLGISIDCNQIRVEGNSWNLSPLSGVHSVFNVEDHPPVKKNTTFTFDLCQPLKESDCNAGTYVCGLEKVIDNGKETIIGTIPIAGNFGQDSGQSLDPKITRLKSLNLETEGLRIELNGGRYPLNSSRGRRQRAVFEMICDPSHTVLKNGQENEDEKEITNKTLGLQYKNYGPADDGADVLSVVWNTKYACENFKDEKGESKQHWGFVTWFIIILFLFIAAYLIFGSWLNYDRYGARGWDLLPHGDTIRDIPYILKDWSRRAVNTIQDPGSRGGYSAV